MNDKELFDRLKGAICIILEGYATFEILKNADTSKPLSIAEIQRQLANLVREGVEPKNVGATHQYLNGEAEEARCVVCGSTEEEQAPECRWN